MIMIIVVIIIIIIIIIILLLVILILFTIIIEVCHSSSISCAGPEADDDDPHDTVSSFSASSLPANPSRSPMEGKSHACCCRDQAAADREKRHGTSTSASAGPAPVKGRQPAGPARAPVGKWNLRADRPRIPDPIRSPDRGKSAN
jgi:hypothetical protein